MYKILSLLFLILISSMSVTTVLGQDVSENQFTVTTDNTVYQEGDVITVSGNVGKILPGTPVILQLFIERTQVDVAQIDVSTKGDFSTTFIASGPLWTNDATISIRAAYGAMFSEINFTFFSQVEGDTFLLNQEVKIPNEGTFDVPYTMKGGILESIVLNQEDLGLDINLTSTSDGSLTLELDRDYVDATKPDGSNEDFIILIYNSQVNDPIYSEFKELKTTDESRTILIPLKENDYRVQIIGTFVIPEFGTITAIVLAAAIIAIIAVTSKSRLSLNNF